MHNLAPAFREQIGPEVLGIFWITRKAISEFPPPFLDVDYLLDGLLTYHLRRTDTKESATQMERHNFFMSHNFGRPFFVAHIHAPEEVLEKDFASLMQLFTQNGGGKKQTKSSTKEKIIILIDKDCPELPAISFLKRSFPDKHFEIIHA
ncbi:MAG: hypothetical protein A2X86_06380 [Bdellovibrionales bacterium GWA2_49_15]|nr:MAG: hypothetical protein A2X86_06380 [Bdellovibrionales bacterium GWA2_49_15]HAZ12101.1 hypothetical protein [Bdellovibrionales bacterium]